MLHGRAGYVTRSIPWQSLASLLAVELASADESRFPDCLDATKVFSGSRREVIKVTYMTTRLIGGIIRLEDRSAGFREPASVENRASISSQVPRTNSSSPAGTDSQYYRASVVQPVACSPM